MFMKNIDGIHLMNPINTEYTLCGDAFDCGTEKELDSLKDTTKQSVTCSRCLEIIQTCKEL